MTLLNSTITYVYSQHSQTVADLGGAAAPPLASFRKIQGLPISKIVRTADSTIIIITDFYLAASSHEIFLRKCLLLYHFM